MKKNWEIWENEKEYGNVFYERAAGKIPEMESSKAIAKLVNKFIKKNDLIMDVGCGGAHYVVSLDKAVRVPFRYCGIDSTKYYIDMANKALQSKLKHNPRRLYTAFRVGDIFNIPAKDNSADIVMCANVFLHLPSIEKPIRELVRAAKKYVIVRTLIGNTSFIIQQVNQPETYDKNGEPANFHFFNIYSKAYISGILDSIEEVKTYNFLVDNDFDPSNIGNVNYANKGKTVPHDLTTIMSGIQVNNYIIEPWQFLIIKKQ